jgi:sugar O-acyltransferase (sialic acid O-acetyltransferase NeuD family)
VACILVGASPKARLVLDFLANEGRSDEVVGFVDADPAKRGQAFCQKPILGDLLSVIEQGMHQNRQFCICLSERRFDARSQYMRRLSEANATFVSIVSRHTLISLSARIEPGSVIFPGVTVNAAARVGACVTLWTGVLVEHDCTIAENVEISPRAAMAGGVSVGARAFLGINATILPNIVIGANALVGAGAVVTRDVAEGEVVVGNPAKVIRKMPQ